MNIDTLSASNPMTIAFIAQLMAVYFLLESLQPVTRQWPFMSYQPVLTLNEESFIKTFVTTEFIS